MGYQTKGSEIRIRAIVIEQKPVDEEQVKKAVVNTAEAGSFVHALAGGIGSMAAMILVYPLASLATIAQAGPESKQDKATKEVADSNTPKSNKEKIQMVIKKIKGLYGGLSPALVGIVATNFVYYYFYELTAKKLRRISGHTNDLRGLSAKESIIAGLVGGVVSRVVTNPIWVSNTRMAVSKGQSGSLFKVIHDIVKNEGWKKLFAGLTPSLALITNPIIQYTIYEQLKTLVVTGKRRAITATDALFLGSISKFFATLLTYPYYTIRARLHMSKGEVKQNMWQMMKEIYHNEGLGGFFHGLGLKLLQGIIGAGFQFYLKEECVIQTQYMLRRLLAIRRKR